MIFCPILGRFLVDDDYRLLERHGQFREDRRTVIFIQQSLESLQIFAEEEEATEVFHGRMALRTMLGYQADVEIDAVEMAEMLFASEETAFGTQFRVVGYPFGIEGQLTLLFCPRAVVGSLR